MSRRYLPLAILALMSAAPAWCGDWNSEGIKAYRAGDYQRAEQCYRQTLSEATDNDTLEAACSNLVILYEAQGKDASEFKRKAVELGKSRTSRVMSNDPAQHDPARKLVPGGSLGEPSVVLQQPVRESSQTESNAQPVNGRPTSAQDASGGTPPIGGAFGMNNVMTESGVGLNTPFGRVGGESRENYGIPGFGYPGGYGTGYSVQTPNGSSSFSNGSPVILQDPNGRPVIIRAPGPNAEVIQRNPDGGTTTIMNRTY